MTLVALNHFAVESRRDSKATMMPRKAYRIPEEKSMRNESSTFHYFLNLILYFLRILLFISIKERNKRKILCDITQSKIKKFFSIII